MNSGFNAVSARATRISSALWITAVWLAIAGSRNLSEWMQLKPAGDGADRYLEGNPVDRAFLSALLALGVIVLLGRRRQVGALMRANGPIVVYFAYCAVSAIWSDYPDVSFKRWFRGAGDIVMVFIILTEPNRLAAFKRLFTGVGSVLLSLSVVLILYFPAYGRFYTRSGAPEWTGVGSDKNALGMVCALFGITFTWCLLRAYQAESRRHRMIALMGYGGLVALAGWLLLKSQCATGLSCWILAGGIMVATSIPAIRRKPALVHLLVFGVLGVVISAMFLNMGSGLVETVGRNSSFTGRTNIWSAVLPMAENPLLGAGYESFWLGGRLAKAWVRIGQPPNQAHNGYIEIYLNLGWAGLMFIAAIMFTGYRNIIAALRRQEDGSALRLAFFVVAAMYNLSESAFKMMHPVWIALLFATAVVPTVVARKSGTGKKAIPPEVAPAWAYQGISVTAFRAGK